MRLQMREAKEQEFMGDFPITFFRHEARAHTCLQGPAECGRHGNFPQRRRSLFVAESPGESDAVRGFPCFALKSYVVSNVYAWLYCELRRRDELTNVLVIADLTSKQSLCDPPRATI